MNECTYEIKKNLWSGMYSISFDGVEVAEGLELHEAVLMIETLMRGDSVG